MSHELRTPLNAVIGFTGTLLMKLPGPLTEDQEHQLQTVRGSARHLLSLINDLLDLAKIESGGVEMHLEPVVCQPVLRDVVTTLTPMAQGKGLALELAMPDEDLSVRADRRAVSQILLNLTNNAIKFTDTGLVRIVLLPPLAANDPVEIRVTDTGLGIREEDQQRLFKAFSQLDASAGRQGTGLGLHLSQKLAELIGGAIGVTSEYGKGSTFMLRLPRA